MFSLMGALAIKLTCKPNDYKIARIKMRLSPVFSSYSSPPWLGAVKIFSPTNLRLPHHIPLITAPSLRWSRAMGMINTKTIINFSFLRQI
jgi:hypothetical protein